MKIDMISEQRTYNLMTQVLDDLVNQKRGKRIAFGRWLDRVGMIEKSNNVTNYRIQFKSGERCTESQTYTGSTALISNVHAQMCVLLLLLLLLLLY